MAFEMVLRDLPPVTGEKDRERALMRFLQQIGYLRRQSRRSEEEVRRSVPFRLVSECFLGRPNKVWRVEELVHYLGTSPPTVYRHLNRLRDLDLIEESQSEEEGKKGYRMRYGNLSKAWSFPEAHIRLAMENLRKSVDHIQHLYEGAEK